MIDEISPFYEFLSEELIRDFLFRADVSIAEAGGLLHLCGPLSKDELLQLMLKLLQQEQKQKAKWKLLRGMNSVSEEIWNMFTDEEIHLLATKRPETMLSKQLQNRIITKNFAISHSEQEKLINVLKVHSYVNCSESWYLWVINEKLDLGFRGEVTEKSYVWSVPFLLFKKWDRKYHKYYTPQVRSPSCQIFVVGSFHFDFLTPLSTGSRFHLGVFGFFNKTSQNTKVRSLCHIRRSYDHGCYG